MDWQEIFGTNGPAIAEVVIRGTITYLAIFALLRVLRRESGAFSIPDLIVVVIVADAAQNSMAGRYNSVPEGIALVATIVAWSYILDLTSYRFAWMRRLLEPSPVVLIRDGLLLKQNLRRNLLSMDELKSQLRENGIESISKVKMATLETDGEISVIPFDDHKEAHGRGVRRDT
jgi:uncharacterized membrane protein YcaP (DUF421 family)